MMTMKTVVVTGGIATGKSTACGMVQEQCGGAEIFDCDTTVHELLTSKAIQDRLAAEFGDQILSSDGGVDRRSLGEIVFADVAQRRLLESILHPPVLQRCLDAKSNASRSGQTALFIADVPLYYQAEFSIEPDEVWVVATSYETQKKRLEARSSTPAGGAEKLISVQMPVEKKIPLADRVIWNEGEKDQLEQQVRIALNSLKLNHG